MPAATSFASAAFEFVVALGGHRLEQRERELPADDRGDLRHLACLAEAVEPRHQRILERRRHRGCPRPPIPSRSWSTPRRTAARHRSWRRSPRRFPPTVRARRRRRRPTAVHSARPSRPSVSSVACGRVSQGGAKSGRAVTTASNRAGRCCRSGASSFRAWWRRSSARLPDDQKHRIGLAHANDLVDQERNESPPCAAPASATTARPRAGMDNSSASNGIAAGSDVVRSVNKAPSFSIRAPGESAAAKRAARDRDTGSPGRARCRCDRASIADGCGRAARRQALPAAPRSSAICRSRLRRSP